MRIHSIDELFSSRSNSRLKFGMPNGGLLKTM